ncbi:MAG: DNA-binding protein, partial [Prosthecobacter sp.]|nr:DNA-binding protein [Prosthecobacter sp.]
MNTRPWFSACDLVGLPGLPKAKRSIRRRADAEGWQFREVEGNGGTRREFHADSLPATTRAALVWNTTAILAGDDNQAARAAAQVGTVEGAKVELKSEMAARAAEAVKAEGLRTVAAMRGNDQ